MKDATLYGIEPEERFRKFLFLETSPALRICVTTSSLLTFFLFYFYFFGSTGIEPRDALPTTEVHPQPFLFFLFLVFLVLGFEHRNALPLSYTPSSFVLR